MSKSFRGKIQMYRLDSDYQELTRKVSDVISQRKSEDPSFSADQIYDIAKLVPHPELDKYRHDTIIRVAAEQGMIYTICEGIERIIVIDGVNHRLHAHPKPLFRANGVFGEVSQDTENYIRDNHRHQENSTMCPECAMYFRKDGRMISDKLREKTTDN